VAFARVFLVFKEGCDGRGGRDEVDVVELVV
jgi:hypothetical protein